MKTGVVKNGTKDSTIFTTTRLSIVISMLELLSDYPKGFFFFILTVFQLEIYEQYLRPREIIHSFIFIF